MKPKKGLTVGWCVNRARRYIEKYGMCLLWFDVKGSKKFPDLRKLRRRLEAMIKDLSFKFDFEKGFHEIYLGDLSWVEINNAEIIPEIIKYQKEKYPDIPVYWGIAIYWEVAKDGDEKKDWK